MNHNAGSIMKHEEICENSSTPSDTDPRVPHSNFSKSYNPKLKARATKWIQNKLMH
jgi:hypothetical protein